MVDVTKMTGPIDVTSMVNIEYQAESTKRTKRLNILSQINNAQIAAFQNVQNLISTYRTSLTNLSNAFSTIAYTAASSNTAVATATATSNTLAAGSHTVVVSQLANAQTSASTTSSSNTLASAETMTFTNAADPTKTFDVTVNAGDSLQTIASNINNSSTNIGIKATVITSNDPVSGNPQYTLSITSNNTGASNGFNITGDTQLGFTTKTAAQDAKLTFDGYNVQSASNTLGNSDGTGGVISGLSFTLTGTGTTNITVAASSSSQSDAVNKAMQDMVTAYNNIMTTIDKYQASSTTYNNSFSEIKSRLQSAMNSATTANGDINYFSKTGLQLSGPQTQTLSDTNLWTGKSNNISYISSGSLSINTDSTKGTVFSTVMSNNFSSLQKFFTDSSTGFIKTLSNVIDNQLIPSNNTGLVYNALTPIQTNQTNIQSQLDQQSKILADFKDSLTLKWSTINAQLAKIQSTSDYLTQNFQNIFGNSNK